MRASTVFFGGLVAIVFLVVLSLRKGVQRRSTIWRREKLG
jgi:hypothetical protein